MTQPPPPPPPAPEPTEPTAPEPTQPVPTQPAAPEPTQPIQVAAPATPAPAALRLDFHAVSDVGRVRKDNQDSGYAGPWLLAVCDGVGGAARGDIASSTAVSELRQLDEAPGGVDLLTRVSDGLHEAHDSIGGQVDQDPALNGTSTTATVALFDGGRLGIGHVGDSRAYLLRGGEISQLTSDHTFVQSLIDEGRITEAEARVHPHRNLILKALDGLHEVEPDLFQIEVVAGDRLFLCSDGACGVLEDDRIARILADGTPEFAAIELVRTSLDAGSSDNVTCVVADVLGPDATPAGPATPQIVGAAAELKRRLPRALFRGHRSGDTGELEPIEAEIADLPGGMPDGVEYVIQADPPVDPEAYRYAPLAPRRFTWARRVLTAAVVIGLGWAAVAAGYWWTQQQYYVGESEGQVVVYRGVGGLPGLSSVYLTSDLAVEDLREDARMDVEDGIAADSVEDARNKIENLAARMVGEDEPTDPTGTPTTELPTPTSTSTSTDPAPAG